MIRNRGWFVSLLSCANAQEVAEAMSSAEKNNVNLVNILTSAVRGANEWSRTSRNNWRVMEHPILEQVTYKAGTDFRTVLPYLIVRVNGAR
jgi:3-hydroxyisobutyrate dehydrogenase-like beta-hydroxyacid dehydrogenase